MPSSVRDQEYESYLESLLAGDRQGCQAIVESLLGRDTPPRHLYIDLFQRSLYRVGDLWQAAEVSVATEHLATAITESLLPTVYPAVIEDREPAGRSAIVACSPNEYHQVGARIVADVLEGCGWDTWFVGADVPDRDVLSLIDEKRPDVLGLSLAMYFNVPALKRLAESVASDFPQLDILIGGQAFRWGGIDQVNRLPGLTFVPSVEELTRLVTSDQVGS